MFSSTFYSKSYHSRDISGFRFLITGGAGFIGSHLTEYLLAHGAAEVRVLDNLSTGSLANIEAFRDAPNFTFIEGDIRDLETCRKAVAGVDYVLHQAALGSVPRSVDDPITSNEVNVSGFLNMLVAIKDSPSVKRTTYAASSSTYGDSMKLPKVEDEIGNPLSPYAVTKYVNELYAQVFARTYGLQTIGIRYFNVFGPRQNPNGAYAAVIPRFLQSMNAGGRIQINGDGINSRDFTYIKNVVKINMLALFATGEEAVNNVYNAACADQVSLNDLVRQMEQQLGAVTGKMPVYELVYGPQRRGDVLHSCADISKAGRFLDYQPEVSFSKGLQEYVSWFVQQ